MTQNLQKIFKNLENIEPSRGLEGGILKAIALENSRKVAKKLMFARGGLAVSFGALAYTFLVFGKAFFASDFWNLAKLAFSDTGIIAKNFGNFSVSLLETFPAAYAAVFLVPVFLLLLSANFYFKSIDKNHTKAWA